MSDLVTTPAALDALCRELAAAGSFGLDMEFQRETTYFPKLQLVQVAFGERVVIVDPLALPDLRPFYELMADPAVEKVFHAGGQDMEIVHIASGRVPRAVFDTQIGAALVGFGEQTSYGTLVSRILGVSLSKLETGTDWARRPLTPAQLDYARDDVRYLLEMRAAIGRRLEDLGRVSWASEEMAYYEQESTYVRDPATLYTRMKKTGRLNRRELAVLRELAIWRDREAAARDRPRARVVSDEVLADIARRAPTSVDELRLLRGLFPKEIKRSGEAIVAAVGRALALPKAEWPPIPSRRRDDEELAPTADLLDIALRARAMEADIGPSYLGGRQALTDLVRWVRDGAMDGEDPPKLLRGWRRELVGEHLVEIARGRGALSVDPDTGLVRLELGRP